MMTQQFSVICAITICYLAVMDSGKYCGLLFVGQSLQIKAALYFSFILRNKTI